MLFYLRNVGNAVLFAKCFKVEIDCWSVSKTKSEISVIT
jgi:hypothetical protein